MSTTTENASLTVPATSTTFSSTTTIDLSTNTSVNDTSPITSADDTTSVSDNAQADNTASMGTNSRNSTSATDIPQNKGLDDGAVAGVAIGCLFAGLIIGAIIMWLVFRKRQRYPKRRRRSENRVGMMYPTRDANTMTPGSSGKTMKLENVILQPAPDKDILSNLIRLDDIITQHAETVYHFEPVDVKVAALAQALTAVGYRETLSGVHIETVASWCIQTDTRFGALRHVLSHILFSTIDWNYPGPLTLLPKPAVMFLNSIHPIAEYGNGFEVMSFAWTRWRTLSALFLHPAPHERTPLEVSESDIQDQVEAVAKALDSVLRYFVAPDEESQDQQRNHLRLMIVEIAKLGYTFFSHTSDWRFMYNDGSGRGRLVVCVGLEKLSDLDGHRLRTPRRIVEPRLMP
ncbi:hypothetical protein FLONG3_2509 [Fusarium longipes]|uniref:Uncharacterized protein n=1 Tax=Fusarium longipes TaxID=694270 RepID=A0A395T3P0_9HYPO|nr:hypothetical protein FLONG3_2509 [Fusarium longipes]